MFLGLKKHAISFRVVNLLRKLKKENQKKNCHCIILNIQISFNPSSFQCTTQESCQSENIKRVGKWGERYDEILGF